MANVWKSIKDTAESLGGAVAAPAGAVLDLAQAPFDDDGLSFGEVAGIAAKAAGKMLDPVVNPETATGGALRSGLQAMNWAYVNAVSEPLATATMATQHSFGQGPQGALLGGGMFHPSNWAELADPQTWAKSYEIAQHESFGEAQAFGLFNSAEDPLRYSNPFEERTAPEWGTRAQAVALTGDLGASLALDPTFLALKGVGAVRGLAQYAKLTTAQRANMFSEITQGSRTGVLRPNLESRTDKYLKFIGGKNSVGRPLSAQEIHRGTPELQRYAKDPEAVAGFLAEANKIENVAERENVQRRILAVAGGDVSQIDRVRADSTAAQSLRDQLANMERGAVIDLDAMAVDPTLANNPIFRLRVENQLHSANTSGDLDRFIGHFQTYNDRLVETQHSLPNLPGVHWQGKRAVNRLNDQGLARIPKHLQEKTLDSWSASLAQRAQSTSSVFQKGKYTVPLVALKTVGLAASAYTKAPIVISDALRQTAYTGVASVHAWGSSSEQLNAMMIRAEVPQGERMNLLNEAYIASTESQKTAIINKVEARAMHGLAAWGSKREGVAIAPNYVEEILKQASQGRTNRMAALQGRAYAATKMPESMIPRKTGAVEDVAAGAESRGAFTAKTSGDWRLDHFNDDGTPLAMPVFETQLGNFIPLIDIDVARKAVARHSGYLSRLSRAWEAESMELGRLAELKAAGHSGLDNVIRARTAARDWAVENGQRALRVWKFSVLFRLGYPMRVLTDDHLRITSKIGAAAFYGPNAKEYAGNFAYNRGLKAAGELGLSRDKIARQQILDHLDSSEMKAHVARRADLKAVESKLTSLRAAKATKETKAQIAQQESARDFIMEQLGDFGPEDLQRELAVIEKRIARGAKAYRPAGARVGEADVTLNDGAVFPGAHGSELAPVYRAEASSEGTYDQALRGTEERIYRNISGGAHRTILPEEDGVHLAAWADALNNQIAMSSVGKFFLNGGTPEGFVKWIKQSEQAVLRRRVAHFAHDPEDWGERAWGIVHDYVPNEAVQAAVLKGRVTPDELDRLVSKEARPAVHGRAAGDNLGDTAATHAIGNFLNRMFVKLSATPTDTLSRHPFFNSMYQLHLQDMYNVRKIGRGVDWTAKDATEIADAARKAALKDLKSTLFDLGAHSHAAHVMRFISPFFSAHQEGVMRWWRIAADNPGVIRRFTQVMDAPRVLHLVVDENGDLVKPGEPISSQHRILLQWPEALGGKDPEVFQSQWSIRESAFNIILQGGLTNPGTGPIVSVPMDYFAQKYAEEPNIARVARIFNPYPANSPIENVVPASGKRMAAYIYGETGVDPSLGLGIGKREYNFALSQGMQDQMVTFQLKNGREPTYAELKKIEGNARDETNSLMFHRFLWNVGTPTPASPTSKYALFQQGWYKLQTQARAEGRDFDWAYAQFKDKYGEAYLPLISSSANNPGWVDANPATVGAIKHYKPLLEQVDPALTRMVVGPYAQEMIDKNATLGDYSVDARNFLRDEQIAPGSSDTYYSYDDPAKAMYEQQARRGWSKYGELTAGLTTMAQSMGLKSYEDSPGLVALKKAGVQQLTSENAAFRDDWLNGVDPGQYERYLDSMKMIASNRSFQGDASRTDITVLQGYLSLRDMFVAALQKRTDAGLGGPDAQAQAPMRQAYTALVDAMVESNTYFQDYAYNGIIERDPLLFREVS